MSLPDAENCFVCFVDAGDKSDQGLIKAQRCPNTVGHSKRQRSADPGADTQPLVCEHRRGRVAHTTLLTSHGICKFRLFLDLKTDRQTDRRRAIWLQSLAVQCSAVQCNTYSQNDDLQATAHMQEVLIGRVA